MKFKSLIQFVFAVLSTMGLGLFFQNCNSSLNAQKGLSSNVGLLGNISNPSLGRSFLSASSDKYRSVSRGFIFYGKLSVAQTTADKTGNQICDYPSLQNCHTNAEVRSRGASTVMESGLSPNSNVHGISFQFYSDGFLSKNTSAHFAVGLRGKIHMDANNESKAVDGRGAILGNLWGIPKNQTNSTCQGMMMQVESYFGINALTNNGEGNTVYPTTCSGAIFQEKTVYNLEVYASRDNKIGYKVKDAGGNLILQKLVQDTYDLIDKNLTDAFVAHVFDVNINSSSDEWSLVIDKINFIESNSKIEDIFNIPRPQPTEQPAIVPSAPVSAAFRVVDQSYGSGTIVLQLNQKIYGVGPNVRACTNPMSRYSVACKNDSDFQTLTQAWGAGAYNATSDVWSININVTAKGYPFGDYFTRFILSDGSRKETVFSPIPMGGGY